MATATDDIAPKQTSTLIVALDEESVDSIAAAVVAACMQLIPEPESDRWLDSEAAADYLDVPVSTIYKLTAAEAIPFSQDGPAARCYFLRSQLDLWRLESAFGPWRMTTPGR